MNHRVAATASALVFVTTTAACGSRLEAAPTDPAGSETAVEATRTAAGPELCVTRGRARIGGAVTEPTVRAFDPGTSGERAELRFVFRGDSETVRELASGQARRQLGLKLRAKDGCNLVYVMWRLDPTPQIDVSVKLNPGARAHDACGADGYVKVRPTKRWPVPTLVAGDDHTLRAAIAGDDLTVWIDDRVAWRGVLPKAVRTLRGPAGLRSDNLAFDLVAFSAPTSSGPAQACRRDHGDERR